MQAFSNALIPVIMGGILLVGIYRGVDVFDVFVKGAAEGLKVSVRILPALVALMTCVGMFRASGALDLLSFGLTPLGTLIGLPAPTLPLMLIRPISGSGAMAIFRDILTAYGPDSFVGRVAAVMQCSTETTFYTIAVYFGATEVKNYRHTIPASLAAVLTGCIMSGVCVALFMGR